MKKLWKFVIIFTIGIASSFILSGCASTNKEPTKPLTIQYEFVQCNKIDKYIDLEKESPDNTDLENDLILTKNIQKMDAKLREAFVIIKCYEDQIPNK